MVALPKCSPFTRLPILNSHNLALCNRPPQTPQWPSQTTSYPQVHPPNYRVHISGKDLLSTMQRCVHTSARREHIQKDHILTLVISNSHLLLSNPFHLHTLSPRAILRPSIHPNLGLPLHGWDGWMVQALNILNVKITQMSSLVHYNNSSQGLGYFITHNNLSIISHLSLSSLICYTA